MKTITLFLTLACLIFSAPAFSTIITVNNTGGAQYTNFQTAMNEAAVGDTLLISGDYNGNFYVDKQLHLFGSGFGNGQGYGLPRAYVQNLRFRSATAGVTPSGSTVSGFEINYIYHIDSNVTFDDILIERNEITADIQLQYGTSNVTIRNNVLRRNFYIHGNINQTIVDLVFENNFIEGFIEAYDRNATTMTLRNNVFADDGQETIIRRLIGATLNNNIFWRQSPGVNSADQCDGCSFNNNIVYYINDGTNQVYVNNPISGIYGNNVGANNILFNDASDLSNPIFTNYANPAGANWSDSYDYHLDGGSTAGSQGINAGTDGTNIGIYGGAYPMPDRILPRIPHVTDVQSLQTSVPIGGTLQIQFSATKQN